LKTFINKDITTLIITDAGAESLDLKGVRNVVLMDSVWNKAAEEQIIGRGQRFKSHAHLPQSKQSIASWKLILDFPKGTAGKSPERQIYEHVEEKSKEMKQLSDLLKNVSI
jgi:type I site-specific restriction endonuclease